MRTAKAQGNHYRHLLAVNSNQKVIRFANKIHELSHLFSCLPPFTSARWHARLTHAKCRSEELTAGRLRQSGRVHHNRSGEGQESRAPVFSGHSLSGTCSATVVLSCSAWMEEKKCWSSCGLGLILAAVDQPDVTKPKEITKWNIQTSITVQHVHSYLYWGSNKRRSL